MPVAVLQGLPPKFAGAGIEEAVQVEGLAGLVVGLEEDELEEFLVFARGGLAWGFFHDYGLCCIWQKGRNCITK